MGVIKGDTRSLDYSSSSVQVFRASQNGGLLRGIRDGLGIVAP